MVDASDETLHLQMLHLAKEGRKATGAKLAAFIIQFWDEKMGKDAYGCVSVHKDGVGDRQMADTIYAVLMTAQTMLGSIDQELMIKDCRTGEVTEFKVFRPQYLLVDDPEEDG